MIKNPAVRFYTSDFLTGCADLTMEERGQYITLLCLQHQKGRLTPKMMKIAAGTISSDVMQKFIKDEDGLYYNERMEIEIKLFDAYRLKQKERIEKRWKKVDSEVSTEEYTEVNTVVLPQRDQRPMTNKKEKKEESERKEEKDKILLEKREEKFKTDVFAFSTMYHPKMLEEFIRYWTEPNKSRTKMRWELEKVFDIKRRLVTWFDRSKDNKVVVSNGQITYSELVRRFNTGEADMFEKYEPITKGDKRSLWKLKISKQ